MAPRGDPATVSPDEAGLLARLREGDERAYEELVQRWGGRMLATIRRILRSEEDALDALQDAFLSAFRGLASFQGGSRLSTWLHRIAINAALMKRRGEERRREAAIQDLLPAFTEGGHLARAPQRWPELPPEALLASEARQEVRARIEELPDHYRIPLVLRDIEGLDNQEVARVLGTTVNAAKIRIHRARMALRVLLDPYVRGESR